MTGPFPAWPPLADGKISDQPAPPRQAAAMLWQPGTCHIRVTVTQPDGRARRLDYAIGAWQAEELRIGRPPPAFDPVALCQWEMRQQRARLLAQAIAADIAWAIVQQFSQTEPERGT